jgi:DnaJ-class molecular chaperone
MVKFTNKDGIVFQFKAFVSASPVQPIPICKYCDGQGSWFDMFGERERCEKCFGKGTQHFSAPMIEHAIHVKLQEYLDKLLTEQEEFKKQFLDIGANI